jgi:eukaryotic-like serine/threonine-protein kinase
MSVDKIQPGEIIGPYRVVKGFRGRGGMAQICEVEVREKYRTPDIPKRMALKVADEEHQPALVAEADYLRRFDHPNVVRIHPLPGRHKDTFAARERFSSGWGWYYAMELLEGGSLEQRLTQTGMLTGHHNDEDTFFEKPLPAAQAWGIVHQLTLALEHIHARSVINLDVKPANILFRKQPFLKRVSTSVPRAVLSDFGIARDPRYPRFGILGVATPAYVSPEHTSELRGQVAPLDSRSDIFSLGVVLYEMLTGQLPFEDLGHIIAPQYVPPPPSELRPRIPEALGKVALRALQKNPNHRYQSAEEMRIALERAKRPTDWVAVGRRAFASVALVAGLAGAGYGGYRLYDELNSSTPTPKPVMGETASPSPSPSAPATSTAEIVATDTVPASQATSTPKPTSTSTPTPLPTFTPTPTPATPETPSPPPESEILNPNEGA